jgi:hypothetical protein
LNQRRWEGANSEITPAQRVLQKLRELHGAQLQLSPGGNEIVELGADGRVSRRWGLDGRPKEPELAI